MSYSNKNNAHFAPLEGTKGPNKALFIKRWGTLLDLPDSGFPQFSDELFTKDAVDSLFRATQAGWTLYLVGNEDHVWSGQINRQTWEHFEGQLLDHLAKHGVTVTRSYACIDDPINGVDGHRKESVFCLPNTGPMHHARQMESIELGSSWVIGDESSELTAGWRAGCLTACVLSNGPTPIDQLETDTAFTATDLSSVLNTIVSAVRAA
jgi:histidinol phosphatase-like enzyme